MLLVSVALPSHAEWRERRAALREMHRVDEFRIFYSRSGTNALPNVEDANRNGTPDYVERIARELVSARRVYADQLRLTHPMSRPRYGNQAAFIDVNLLSFPLSPGGPRNGVAYDELSSLARVQDGGKKVRVLVVDIANSLPANNATAAHELFHLYQNGYTFFKNRWYTEGTARWAEQLGKASSGKPGRLPQSPAEMHELFRQSYETAPFWRRLAVQLDPGGRNFIKAFLEELDRMDDAVSAGASGKWQEADQMSSANDIYLWRALRSTLQRPEFLPLWDEDIRRLMAIDAS
jgi:hypothetical protein